MPPPAMQILDLLGAHLPTLKTCQADRARLAEPEVRRKQCN
jgi:hypothetical protein